MANLMIVLALLAFLTACAFVRWWANRLDEREMQRSNARVLREFKRIARREPNRVFERHE